MLRRSLPNFGKGTRKGERKCTPLFDMRVLYWMQPAVGPSPSLSVTKVLPVQVLMQAGRFKSPRSTLLPKAVLACITFPLLPSSILIPYCVELPSWP
jgi:hypothetical protein